MGNLLRQNKYTEPVFKRKKYLSRGLDEKSFSVLIEMKSLILEFNKSRIQKGSQEKFESEIITQDKKKSKALIVIPKGWLNSESVEGRTQGLQIKFLIEGLRNIGFDISVFEVSKRNCDLTPIKNKLEEFNVIFIWSLTIISPGDEFYEY
jgi:hypothetical protein